MSLFGKELSNEKHAVSRVLIDLVSKEGTCDAAVSGVQPRKVQRRNIAAKRESIRSCRAWSPRCAAV